MLLSFAIWLFEAAAAAAISAVVTGVAFCVGIAFWLHGPKHEMDAQTLQPAFAVDEQAKEG
jgi:hypothetical protein